MDCRNRASWQVYFKKRPFGLTLNLPNAGFQLWMWGRKNDSTNDRSTLPLKEQVFGVIPLVLLFTVYF
jgi:hypothetical protein